MIYTDPYIDTATSQMIISMAIPVSIDNKVVGVLGQDITIDYLVKLVDDIKISDKLCFSS